MKEDFQVRSEDFRRAWPNALHRALVESSDLAYKLDEQRASIEELARMTPKMMDAARTQLREVTEAHLAQIAKANSSLFEAQSKFMAAFSAERQALKIAMESANAQKLKIETSQKNLDKKWKEFNSLSLFKRIFYRA